MVPTISFKLLYGFVVMSHDRRKILYLSKTAHPSAEWIARQLTEAVGWDRAPRYIIRDRDGAYGEVFKRRLRAMGIRDRPTAPQSPWQNGCCERLIGSIRRECLDHVVILGERHLRHVLPSYAHYYNSARTHLSLSKDSPVCRAVQTIGSIQPIPLIGGLHQQYVRIWFAVGTGVAVSFIVMALANLLIFLGDPRATHTVVFWMLGGLGLAQWTHLIWPLLALVPLGLWLWLRAGDLNAMTVGDETAATLGLSVARFRLSVFVAGALITGVMVAFSGIIGFVGLMVPHIARMIVGGDHARVLPASAVLGAILLLWADIAARTVMAPENIPIGIVTGLVGGVFFVWLLRRRHL